MSMTEDLWQFYTVVRMGTGDEFRAQLYGDEGIDPPDGYEPAWRESFEPAVRWLQSRGGGLCVAGFDG
jgi:hypothetical protein